MVSVGLRVEIRVGVVFVLWVFVQISLRIRVEIGD